MTSGANFYPDDAVEDADAVTVCGITGKAVRVEDTVEFQGHVVSAEGKHVLMRRYRYGQRSDASGLVAPSIMRRWACTALDVVLLWIVRSFAVQPAIMVISYSVLNEMNSFFLGVALIGLNWLATGFYYVLFQAKYGKTLGKMAGGYKVVNMDGSPINTVTAIKRFLGHDGITLLYLVSFFDEPMIDFLPVVVIVMLVYMAANSIVLIADKRHNRAIHDRFAGTRVVMDKQVAQYGRYAAAMQTAPVRR